MQHQHMQRQQMPPAAWMQYAHQYPVQVPASMVAPNLITFMSSPSNQGNVPALAASTGQEGGDQ
eukprot:12903523-Prorocentrum_lima.AAC.1